MRKALIIEHFQKILIIKFLKMQNKLKFILEIFVLKDEDKFEYFYFAR